MRTSFLFNIPGLLMTIVASIRSFSQAYQAISYQPGACDSNGNLLANRPVTMRISVLDSNINRVIVYQETHNATNISLGLFTVNIGQGILLIGSFSSMSGNFKSIIVGSQ